MSDILKNALMGIETANFEFPLLTSGDHVVEVLLNATTRRDAQDNVIGKMLTNIYISATFSYGSFIDILSNP